MYFPLSFVLCRLYFVLKMGVGAVKVTIMNFMSFKFNYLKNVNGLKLRSVRSQDTMPGSDY